MNPETPAWAIAGIATLGMFVEAVGWYFASLRIRRMLPDVVELRAARAELAANRGARRSLHEAQIAMTVKCSELEAALEDNARLNADLRKCAEERTRLRADRDDAQLLAAQRSDENATLRKQLRHEAAAA